MTTYRKGQTQDDHCIAQRDGAVCGRSRSEHNVVTAECPWHEAPAKPGETRVPPSAARGGRGVVADNDRQDVPAGVAVQKLEPAAAETSERPKSGAKKAK